MILRSTRVELESGARTEFAHCYATKLSPSGRFFACRDRAANVLRVPVTGGEPTQVVASGLRPEQVEWTISEYIYPDPVSFRTPESVHVETQVVGADESREVTAPWTER